MSWVPIPVKRYLSNLLADYVERGGDADLGAVSADSLKTDLPVQASTDSGMQRVAGEQRNRLQSITGGAHKCVVSWIFDDGNESLYTHRDAFRAGGVPPSLGIITERPGRSAYLTWDEIAELQTEYDAEIGNHTHTHEDLGTISPDEARATVYRGHVELLNRGYDPEWFVYPKHGSPDYAQQIASELYGYAFIGSDRIIEDNELAHRLPRIDTQAGRPLADIKADIDAAAAANTGIALYGHLIIDGEVADEGTQEVSTAKLEEIGQYVANHADAEWGHASETVKHTKMPITQLDAYGTGVRFHGEFREDIGAGYTKTIRDGADNVIVQLIENGDFHYNPNGGIRTTLGGFSRMNLEGNTLAYYDNGSVVGRVGSNGFDFNGNPAHNVDTGGATPGDTTAAASWEEVTGEDGATYYRPLYQ